MTGDDMVGWHHSFNGQEFEQTPGDDEQQDQMMNKAWRAAVHGVSKSWT